MKFTYDLLYRLPIRYRCAVNRIAYKPQLFFVNFIQVFLIKYIYDRNPTILCDHHIVGNNPFINMLLIYYIGLDALQKEDKINITITIPNQNDYWAYSLVNSTEIYETLSIILEEKIESFSQFLKFITRKIPMNKINIYYNRTSVEWSRYDQHIQEFLFSTIDSNNIQTYINNEDLSPIIIEENKIRKELLEKSIEHLERFDIMHAIENNKPQNGFKIFSPTCHISSFPQGWMAINTYQETEEDTNTITLDHNFKRIHASYGSANSISSNYYKMKENSIQHLFDISKIFQKNISKHRRKKISIFKHN